MGMLTLSASRESQSAEENGTRVKKISDRREKVDSERYTVELFETFPTGTALFTSTKFYM